MVTAAQIDRLGKRIDQLAAVIDPGKSAVRVVVFSGETAKFALQRHRELRPEHTGRLIDLEHRNVERDDVNELFACHSEAEVAAAVKAIWRENEGRGVGAQFLSEADA